MRIKAIKDNEHIKDYNWLSEVRSRKI